MWFIRIALSVNFLFVHVRTSFVHGLRNSFEVTLVTRSIAGQLDSTPRATLDKHASVKIDNSNFKFMSIQIGAPQDSVLGPVLFTLYTQPLI